MGVLKPWFTRGGALLLLAALIVVENGALHMMGKANACKRFADKQSEFRQLHVSPDWVSNYMGMEGGLEKEASLRTMTLGMLYHDFSALEKGLLERTPLLWRALMGRKECAPYYDKYKALLDDLKEFPVPEDVEGGVGISYEDSWGCVRNYGGESWHEGTDLMTQNNERGYFPVISITDGVVEKKGWLEKGGYRIGIRSPSGAYFYYAHLYEYAPDLEVGDTLKAGKLLGSMGDSGYGEEGTTGQFDVHLHMGVYLDVDGQEMAVNPYYLLKALEQRRISFRRKKE